MELEDLPEPLAALVQRGLAQAGFYSGTFYGRPGPKTRAAYRRYLDSLTPEVGMTFPEHLAAVAEGEVGRREAGVNGGVHIRKYQGATWYAPGEWPWCAAFVCWCWKEAAKAHDPGVQRPTTPGAWKFEDYARDTAGVQLLKPARVRARRGDIVVYTFSHVGIVVADQVVYGQRLQTVEGNTDASGGREGDGVYRRERKQTQVRSLVRLGA